MHMFSKKRIIIPLIMPTLLVYFVYIILPIFVAAYYSLTDFTGISKPKFVGLKNYLIVFRDELFWNSLKNTLIVLMIAFIVLVPAAFSLALLLNEKLKGMTFYKAMTFTPNIIAPIIAGLVWVFVLDPKIGLLNNTLSKIGLDFMVSQWIGGKVLTPYSVGFVYVWQVIGFNSAIFLAGLKMISNELYEAASVEGASFWQKLFYITIPCMKETNLINLVLIITGVFKVFEVVIQLTNGGPNHLSQVLTTYMYHTTFKAGNYGRGMAMAVITFALSMGLTSLFLAFGRKKEVD